MKKFSVDQFVGELEDLLAGPKPEQFQNKLQAIRARLAKTIQEYGPEEMVRALSEAVPPNADIGELIVHQSEGLTLLFGRIPPHFQSAIHDHTVCACIGQLVGEERSVIYEPTEDGRGLRAVKSVSIKAGEVMTLPADAIHHIENPCDETSSALHIYGGEFSALAPKRSLWSHAKHERQAFSFPALLKGSVEAMKLSGNESGLTALIRAMPAAKQMTDATVVASR